MKRPEYEQMEVPRLDPKVKAMNGKSTKRLAECIDDLCDVLDGREAAEDVSVKSDEDEAVSE